MTNHESRGTRAAYGARAPIRARLRRLALRALKTLEVFSKRRRDTAAVLALTPPVATSEEAADLFARLNWYLPAATRQAQLRFPGSSALPVSPDDAPHMDPMLVASPGAVDVRPSSRVGEHLLVHRVTARSVRDLVRARGNATIVDPRFAYGADEAYFRVHRAVCSTSVPDDSVSAARLLGLARPGGTALVLATGPSASEVELSEDAADVRITCNSAVRDHDLIRCFRPTIVAFGDPVFHYGPSQYAAAFRRDLRRALDESDALVLTTNLFVEPLLAHMPEISSRVAVVQMMKGGPWHWPTGGRFSARITGNVLTNLMLPAAFALTDHIQIAGCDGRNPDEKYYWRHNTRTQYTDDLMRSAFDAHEAFFRDREYADYYATHCQQLEGLLVAAEAGGKRATGVTRSHIPALLQRGAPTFS